MPLSDNRISQSDCPIVEGRYHSENPARIAKAEVGRIDERIHATRSARLLFRHPRNDKSHWVITKFEKPIAEEQLFFEILQPNENEFELRRTFANGEALRSEKFNRQLGDFSCRDGFIIIKPYLRDQTGKYVKNSPQFARARDGALLYYEKAESVSWEMLIRSSQVFHNWYRFSPMSMDSK